MSNACFNAIMLEKMKEEVSQKLKKGQKLDKFDIEIAVGFMQMSREDLIKDYGVTNTDVAKTLVDMTQEKRDQSYYIIAQKVANKEPLTSIERGIALSIMGFGTAIVAQCPHKPEPAKEMRRELQKDQLLHVIIRSDKGEYHYDLGIVVGAFDQVIVIHLERGGYSISVDPEQIVDEYRKEYNIECKIITKCGKPVLMQEKLADEFIPADEEKSEFTWKNIIKWIGIAAWFAAGSALVQWLLFR